MRRSGKRARERVEGDFRFLGMEKLVYRLIMRLSAEKRQRVFIVRAFAHSILSGSEREDRVFGVEKRLFWGWTPDDAALSALGMLLISFAFNLTYFLSIDISGIRKTDLWRNLIFSLFVLSILLIFQMGTTKINSEQLTDWRS